MADWLVLYTGKTHHSLSACCSHGRKDGHLPSGGTRPLASREARRGGESSQVGPKLETSCSTDAFVGTCVARMSVFVPMASLCSYQGAEHSGDIPGGCSRSRNRLQIMVWFLIQPMGTLQRWLWPHYLGIGCFLN